MCLKVRYSEHVAVRVGQQVHMFIIRYRLKNLVQALPLHSLMLLSLWKVEIISLTTPTFSIEPIISSDLQILARENTICGTSTKLDPSTPTILGTLPGTLQTCIDLEESLATVTSSIWMEEHSGTQRLCTMLSEELVRHMSFIQASGSHGQIEEVHSLRWGCPLPTNILKGLLKHPILRHVRTFNLAISITNKAPILRSRFTPTRCVLRDGPNRVGILL